MLLTSTVFLPLLGMLLCLVAPARLARVINVATNAVVLLLVIAVWGQMESFSEYSANLTVGPVEWISGFYGINFHMAVDGLGLSLLLLTAFVSLTAAIASWNIEKSPRGYHAMFLLLLTGMLGVFVSMDLFLFYVFWEIMLLPMYFLIGIWGGPNRQYAAIKFFIYTLFGSVLLLAAVILVVLNTETWSIPEITQMAKDLVMTGSTATILGGSGLGLAAFIGMFIGFAIKVPSFPFHTWLPDAHVEAPTPISMILAGVLLKMGGYGLIRIAYPFFPSAAASIWWLVALLAVISIVYGAFVAMSQSDFKRLIAYSSVSHMGFVTLGLAAATTQAINGAMYMMLAHGTISAMLFMIVGVIYDRAHHRDIDRFGGLAWTMPRYAILASFAFFASLGLPGLSGFIAEITTFVGAFGSQIDGFRLYAILALLGIVITAGYYLITLQKVFLGKPPDVYTDKKAFPDVTKREMAVLLPLAAVTLVMGVWPAFAMNLYAGVVDGFKDTMAAAIQAAGVAVDTAGVIR